MGLRYVIARRLRGLVAARCIDVQTGPVFVSSGDLIADRRYQWALDYLARGELAERGRNPRAGGGARAGLRRGLVLRSARSARRRASGSAPSRPSRPPAMPIREDYHGARLHLARLGVGEATPAMTAAYVRRLFDQQRRASIRACCSISIIARRNCCSRRSRRGASPPAGLTRFTAMLDLGCGTGLAGAAFRGQVDRLTGVDISAAMIEEARAQGASMTGSRPASCWNSSPTEAEAQAPLRSVVAADVFVYIAGSGGRRGGGARACWRRRPVRLHGRDPCGRGRACWRESLALRPRRRPCARRHGGRGSRRSPRCPRCRPAPKRASRCRACWGSRLQANNDPVDDTGRVEGRRRRSRCKMTPELLMLALSVVLGLRAHRRERDRHHPCNTAPSGI